MLSCEAERTLIKSPLELWEELGDPAGLSRHLGKLGEISITRAEPERKVEWESEELSGTVVLAASGWGTKVTLTAAGREPSQSGVTNAPAEGAEGLAPEGPEAEALTAVEPEPVGESTQAQAAAHVEPAAHAEAAREPASTAPGAVTPEASVPRPSAPDALQPQSGAPAPRRRGFFARLFRRRARTERPVAHTVQQGPRESQELGGEELDGERHTDLGTGAAAEAETRAATAGELHAGAESQRQGAAEAHGESGAESQRQGAAEAHGESEAQSEAGAAPESEAEAVEAVEPEAGAAPESEAEAVEAVEPEPAPRLGIWLEEIERAEAAEVRASRGSRDRSRGSRLTQEEVHEVLTQTLDRLGAAHHRPFSRA